MPLVWLNGVVARRPALPAAVLFILGICLHPVLPRLPVLWLAILAAMAVIAVGLLHRSACCIPLAIAVVITGTSAGQLAAFYYPANHLGQFIGDDARLGWVQGTIADAPRLIESPPRGRKVPDRQLLAVHVTGVRTWNGWRAAAGELPVTVSPPQLQLAAGQTVRMLGRLERPPSAMNPGGADPAARDRLRRVLLTMHISRPYDVEILAPAAHAYSPLVSLRDRFRRWLDAGFLPGKSPDRALLRALVFGDREPALRAIEDDFNATGTAHVLAANGARVAMLAAILYLLLRLLSVPPRPTVAITTVAVAVLGLLTMPVAQAIRPVVVCAALGIGLVARRAADSIQLLALAALAVLVLRPLDLYSAGFQLSFVIVLGLILFTRPVLQFLKNFEDSDKRIARSSIPQSTWRRGVEWLRRRAVEGAVAGLVAWTVAMPLVAYHFAQFNWWTVPFSLLLTPVATAALACGFAKVALTAICPPLAGFWAILAAIPAAGLRHSVALLAEVPGADVPAAAPAVWQMFLFYAMLCLPLLSWPRARLRWCVRCAPAGGCAVLLLLPLCGGFGPQSTPHAGVRVTLLFVGAGQCAVIEPAGGGVVLLDAGSSTVSDPLRTAIGPFLRHERVWSIDTAWLSHGDFDHISAIKPLLTTYGIGEVRTSPYFREHAHESRPCAALLESLDQVHQSPRLVLAGDHARLGRGSEIQVLWPPPGGTFNSNNAGLVLRLTCAGRSILFPADIQEPPERELLKNPQRLRSDVLIAPHHGSSETSTPEFVRAVNPRVILSSNDARLTMKQRRFETEIGSRPLYRTSRCGAITLEIGADGSMRVTPFHGTAVQVP